MSFFEGKCSCKHTLRRMFGNDCGTPRVGDWHLTVLTLSIVDVYTSMYVQHVGKYSVSSGSGLQFAFISKSGPLRQMRLNLVNPLSLTQVIRLLMI